MEIKDLIKSKLLQYLSQEISKDDLYNWALNTLHIMLKGSIFDVECLEVWGIITKLADVNDSDDLYCHELATQFYNILLGNESATFSFAVQIPPKFAANNLSQTKKILQKYFAEKHLSPDEILELKLVAAKRNNTFRTLNEMLKLQILNLLTLGYDFEVSKNGMEFNLKSTIFISEDLALSLENDFLVKVLDLLECYDGKKSFYVHISFNNGTGNISLQV